MHVFLIVGSLILSFLLSAVLRPLFQRYRIVDKPKSLLRKIHKKPTPFGGGLAIFLTITIVGILSIYAFDIMGATITARQWWGITLAGLILFIGGIIDDAKGLSAKKQLLSPILAALTVLGFGIGLTSITNPFGGNIFLNDITIPFGDIGSFVLLADLIVFFWLMSMMYTTKLLDGLDGLVTGMTSIGTAIILFLTLPIGPLPQPEVAVLASIVLGACLGFLPWNWHRARMFLGEGGSVYTGFILGVLAIISGSKLATTFLIMGIPMLDIVRVLFVRYKKKKPLFVGDKEHLHFKLVEKGFSSKQTVFMFYAIACLFGMSSLFLQQEEKLVALGALFVLMLVIGVWFSQKSYED